jgi:DNA replication protein DnaC
MCKTLKLDRVAIDYGGLAQTAIDQQVASDFLEQVLGAETAMRTERTREVLARLAGFPGIKTLEGFDFGFAAGVPKAQILEMASLRFIERAHSLVPLIGRAPWPTTPRDRRTAGSAAAPRPYRANPRLEDKRKAGA